MIVVADTTPLLVLAQIDALNVIRELFGEVLIPREVHRELVERRPTAEGVARLRSCAWIVVVDAPSAIPEPELLANLDDGEAAALRLALAHGALVLIDERAGRRVARTLRLSVRGTLGLLVDARRRGIIQQLRPVLDELDRIGFRASPDLRSWALRSVGEAS